MSKGEGAKIWLIPDGYLATPPGDGKPYQSHEAICVLNTGTEEAHIKLDFYFEDREPIKDVSITVGAERTFHIRLDKPEHLNGVQLPLDVPYAIRVRSDAPIIVQHSRLDTTQTNLALMTTIAYPIAKGAGLAKPSSFDKLRMTIAGLKAASPSILPSKSRCSTKLRLR